MNDSVIRDRRMRSRTRWAATSMAVAGATLTSTGSLAQDEPASKTDLPAVYVTAQKTKQTLEQIPASVTSLDSDLIHDVGADNFNDLAPYTGGATIKASGSSGQLTIRGFGTVDSNQGLDPSVGVVYDGVFYGRSNYLAALFNDVDRFEVLRGPQGTLFGKNVTAGILNITSAEPTETRLVKWELESAEGGRLAFRPVLQTGLGDGLSIRFSGNYDTGDPGLLYNTFLKRRENNSQQETSRVRLRYDSHQNWTLDLGAFISMQNANYNLFQLQKEGPNLLALARTYDPATETNIDGTSSADVPSQERDNLRGLSITGNIDLSQYTGMKSLVVTTTTGGAEVMVDNRNLDADFTAIPFIKEGLAEPSPERQLTQEFRIAGNHPDFFGYGYGINFVAGLFYENATLKTTDLFQIEDLGAAFEFITAANADYNNQLNTISPNGGLGGIAGQLNGPLDTALALLNPVTGALIGTQQQSRVDLQQRSKSYASFGQFEYFFLPRWALIGGLRFGREDKDATADSIATGVLIPLISDQKDFNGKFSRTEIDISPKAGLKWELSKRLSTYATFSQGTKSGGYNALPLNETNIEFQPEHATNFEVGTKARFPLLGGGARLSAAVFTTNFDNLQESTFQNTSVFIRNAAKARSSGFEADLFWLPPIDGVSLLVASGFADARYISYPGAPVTSDAPQCQTSTTFQNSGCTQDLSGRRLPFASRWTASAVPAYTIDLSHGIASTFAFDVLYTTSRYTNVDEDPRKLQPAVTKLNARVILADSAQKIWSLTFRAMNLTNVVTVDETVDQPVARGDLATIRSDAGRGYSANLMFRFY